MKDVRALFGINRDTWQRWLAEGLSVVEKDANPLLAMGSDLIDFLKKKKTKGKKKLGEGDFWCIRCRGVVKALEGTTKIVKTGKKVGRDNLDQIIRTAECELCGTTMRTYLSSAKQDYCVPNTNKQMHQ